MKTQSLIEFQDQKENLKPGRKTLKVLQQGTNKENLAGRTINEKSGKFLNKQEPKHRETEEITEEKSTQTGEAVITAEHLISDEPNADYWKKLAEKRQEMLDDSFCENERLKDHVEALKEENKICNSMLDESRNLVAVLKELLADTSEDALES